MTSITANCRDQLTAEDFRAIGVTLAKDPQKMASLTALLTDPAARDAALESEQLFRALLESPECMAVSPRLYFYVLTRRLLSEFDREIADYIASLLTAFLDVRRLRSLPHLPGQYSDYVADMLAALTTASSEIEFYVRVHVGNYSLFMSGIFPEHLRHRASVRGAPDISFYEEVGSTNYRLASGHRLAHRHALADVYRTIADRFSEVRRDLNRLSDELLCLEPVWSPAQ